MAVEVVKVVKIYGKFVWIESDFFGARHVMVQHNAPGEEPFCYASFHYDYRHTSNSSTLADAERVARALGAQEPIDHRMRAMGIPVTDGGSASG